MVEGGSESTRPTDLWPWFKEILATVETAVVDKQPGSRPKLEQVLNRAGYDFKNLLKNPPPNSQDAEMIRKATSEGIKLPGSEASTTLSASLVEEALIVSDLFKLNEISSLQLLLHGEEQLPLYPGLTRGLVAVILYYDGRKAVVQALRTLIAGRRGNTWSTDTHPEVADLVEEVTSGLMTSGLTETILNLLSTLDWAVDVAPLQKHAALGDPQHVHTISLLHRDVRQNLADCLYCYSAQSGLSGQSVTRILEHLARTGPTTATGHLDSVTAGLLMAVLASCDVSGLAREEDQEQLAMVEDPTFITMVSRELEGRSRKWENPGVLSVLQLAWSMTLAGLRVAGVNIGAASSHLEEDEVYLDLALDGKVFHYMPNILLTCPSFHKEEFYQRRLHTIITDFLILMPLKIKELRNRADDSARNAMMHEQEGIQYSVPLLGQHFSQLLLTVAAMYSTDKLELQLADQFWCPTEAPTGPSESRSYPARQVALYKFVRLAGDLLMPSLFVPYIRMLTGLADTDNSAPHCFKLLKLNGSGSANVSFDHFFQSLSQYHQNLQQVTPVGPDHTIYRTKPLTKGISPQEVAGLSAVLGLVTVLADRSETARVSLAEHPGWSVVPTVLGLLGCSVPTTIKAKLVDFLSALAKSADIVHPLWQAVEGSQLVSSGKPGMVGELEDVESRAEEFPLTKSFLKLLDRLTDTEIPGSLGSATRPPGFQPYLTFIQDQVFLKFNTRTYKNPAEKWEVAASCLSLLHKLVSEYEPSVEDFQGGNSGVGLSPGFFIMSHLHQTSLLLRTVLFVLDEARSLLDTFSPFPGKTSLEAAATSCLALLDKCLSLSENFISCGRTAGASVVLTALSKLMLGLNPRSGRPDHLLNVSRFVLYGYWLPTARLSAVRIIGAVSSCPVNQAPLLATLTSTPQIANSVLKAFTDAIDTEDDEEADLPGSATKREAGATRLAIMDLLQTGLIMAAPSLAHFLLGFDLKKGVGKSQLQSPHVVGVRTPLHAILSLLDPAELGQPTPILTRSPHLVTAAFRLLFTLVYHPLTSDMVLRYLRSSSDFLAGQLATLPNLLLDGSVQAQRSAAWLLRAAAVEIKALSVSRQHSQLVKMLGLLLDASETQDENELPAISGLYADATFSQLSRTMGQSQTRQLDAPVSNHRLAAVLNAIDFEMETLSAPTWELFDDSQVAGVLEQCQTQNQDSASQELLVDIPKLHKILAMELSTIQGSAAMNQRAMIQSEIQSILVYAVRWNSVQEGAAARRDLLDSWRQVAETLITVTPADLLSSSSKQQILLQLLQSLINKVSEDNLVPGLDNLVSSTVLLLLTSLRTTYEGIPDRQSVMGETFVGMLDNTVTGDTTGGGQVFSASLQVVLKGLVSWLLAAGAGSQSVRTNLYAAMLAYLRIGKDANNNSGEVLELSERGKLQKANLEVVQSYGTNLLEVLARDATTGHEVRRMLALAVLDELIYLDRQAATIRFLANQGFLKHVTESLCEDENGLVELLTKSTGNIRFLYVFESKINMLVRVACNPVGAELLLQAGLMARLSEFSVISLRPDPDAALLRRGEEEDMGILNRYHSIMFPVLRLCQAVLASLGIDNMSASAQVLQFLTGHGETVSMILRGSAARSSLHPALLQELSLMSSVVSRSATLPLAQDLIDASSIELQGQQTRMQRQMLSLLTQFQLTDSLVSALGQSKVPSVTVLQIISNVISFARNLVSASSSNPRTCRLVVSPSLLEALESQSDGPTVSSRPASLGLLVATLRTISSQLARSQGSLSDSKDKLTSLHSLPHSEMVSLAEVSHTDKLPASVVRKLAQDKVTGAISVKNQEVTLCVEAIEGLAFLVWRHLEHFLLYSTAAERVGPSTPFQQAFSRHQRVPEEMGLTSMSPRTAFVKVDLERLKSDASTILNDTFFDKLTDKLASVESVGGAGVSTGFLQSVLRRTKRLAALHTQ